MGCDKSSSSGKSRPGKFQSTHPAWGVTAELQPRPGNVWFQSTHPAWGVTVLGASSRKQRNVSIHTPRVGCDFNYTVDNLNSMFQSTHPAWGVTELDTELEGRGHVSIHTPRVGCDLTFWVLPKVGHCFNPHTPRGV